MRRLSKIILILLLLLNLIACNGNKQDYRVKDFFNDIATELFLKDYYELEKRGLELANYEIEKYLSYDDLANTFISLMNKVEEKPLDYLKELGWVKENIQESESVEATKARELIVLLIDYLNNPQIGNKFEYSLKSPCLKIDESLKELNYISDKKLELDSFIYSQKDNAFYQIIKKDGNNYHLKEAIFTDLFSDLEIENKELLDFNKAEVILPSGAYKESSCNPKYRLLSSNGDNVFYYKGYRISYHLNTSGIRLYVSKKEDSGFNFYGEFAINNVKPYYQVKYEANKLKHAFWKVNFNSSERIGFSKARYNDYAINFKELDKSSFMNLLRSTIKPLSDEELSIPLCTIKIPVNNIPTMYVKLDLALHFYLSGRVELAINDVYETGFEIKDGSCRLIAKHNHDIDGLLKASGNSYLHSLFHLETLGKEVANIGVDAGIKAYIQTIMHFYDDNGQKSIESSDLAYDAVADLASENNDVKVCGDLSFAWLLNIIVNSQDSLLGSWGLSKNFDLLDDDNQVFNNLSHIEDGHFVPHCTRIKRTNNNKITSLESDKILLEKYAIVIKNNERHKIPIKALPKGYTTSDLIIESKDKNILEIDGLYIKAIKGGSSEVLIKTSDNKHQASLNILVSNG